MLKDLASVLPDEYIHLGGDEANTACWEQSKAITDWIAREGLGGVAQARYEGAVVSFCTVIVCSYRDFPSRNRKGVREIRN